MFGLSLSHLILFGIIALIFIGPEQLPEVARTIGRLLNELRRATSEFQGQFTGQFRDESEELRNLRAQLREQNLHQPPPPPTTPEAAPVPPLPVAPGPYEGQNTDSYSIGETGPVVVPETPEDPEKKS